MSEPENALTGADAAPAPEESVQDTPQTPAPVETDEQRDERERDEKGRFAPVQKRINELTREKYEALRSVERERSEKEFLRQQLQQYQNPRHTPDLSDPDAYIAHLAEQKAVEVLEQREAAQRQQSEQQRFAETVNQFAQRSREYAQQHPDFEEALYSVDQVIGQSPALVEVLASSDHGPAVVHYLGSHLDEAVTLANLPPHLAAAHLARLESRLSAPKPKPVTAAPAPAPTVGGGSAAPKDPNRMTTAEWMAWRNSQ